MTRKTRIQGEPARGPRQERRMSTNSCDWKGCTAEATHAPKVCVPAKGWPLEAHEPLSMIVGLKCCLEHAQKFDVQGTLAIKPKGLRQVFEILAEGKCAPDFDRAYVEPISIDSEAYRVLMKARKP